MIIDDLLTFGHVALLMGIFAIIFSYRPDSDTRKRPGVSLLAVLMAGTCFASSVMILLQLEQSCQPTQPWQTLFTLCVFIAVARTRGNVAKLLPRLKWSHRP